MNVNFYRIPRRLMQICSTFRQIYLPIVSSTEYRWEKYWKIVMQSFWSAPQPCRSPLFWWSGLEYLKQVENRNKLTFYLFHSKHLNVFHKKQGLYWPAHGGFDFGVVKVESVYSVYTALMYFWTPDANFLFRMNKL